MNDRQIRGENRDILCGDLLVKEKTGRTCIQIDRVIVMDLHCGTAHNRSFFFFIELFPNIKFCDPVIGKRAGSAVDPLNQSLFI